MELRTVENYATEKLTEYGLSVAGWTFRWDRSVVRFGQCRYGRKEIGVSRELSELNDEPTVFDTILHEIAHALVKLRGLWDTGHGHNWQTICKEIGAKPERYYTSEDVVIPKGKYTGTCPVCSKTFEKSRKPKREDYHIKCNPGRMGQYPIEWSENKVML